MKTTMMAMVMAIVMLIAGFAGADDVNVTVRNDNTLNNNTNATATANANQNQDQQQEQNQRQHQEMIFNDSRNHIVAQPGPSGNFVTGTAFAAGGCTPLFGEGLHKTFSTKQIAQMSDSGSAWEGKGGWFHSLFTSDINAVAYESFEGSPDERPITLINWEPTGSRVYPGDRIIGEVSCTGDYGWPLGSVLGKCLAEAKQTTNTTRVFACITVRNDSKNSGFSIGTGGAVSKLNGGGAGTAASVALGGLIGTTASFVDTAFDVKIIALNDGYTEWKTIAPVAPPVAKPAPAPKPEICNPDEIWARIHELEKELKKCERYCYNNLTLRQFIGDAYVELYVCTGDKRYLSTVNGAAYHYGVAERNYLKGWDIKSHKAEADSVIAQVYYNWAGVIYETKGREQAMKFAQAKRLERIPTGFAR